MIFLDRRSTATVWTGAAAHRAARKTLATLAISLAAAGCATGAKTTTTVTPAPETKATFTSGGNQSMAQELRSAPPADYVLGPGDVLEISVLRLDEFRAQVTVGPTGKLSYYLVDDIQAAGLTTSQLRNELQDRLKTFIREPVVLVRITEYRSQKVFVLGQVTAPGLYSLRGSTTLIEALAMAGGVTANAYLRGAYLVREGQLVIVDFPALVERGNTQENVPLRPNDVIFIPDRSARKVFVLGEVKSPSAIVLDKDMTLLDAIATAGGFTHDANAKTVAVIRGGLSQPQLMTVDLESVLKGTDFAANLLLEQRDVVFVATTGLANFERFMARMHTILQPIIDLERAIIFGPLVWDALTGESAKARVIVSP
jgi:polysaccharide export outer membrane protein